MWSCALGLVGAALPVCVPPVAMLKRCGADSASERGVCRRRFERWQIVIGGHTRQRGEGEYRTRLANNRGVTTTGIEVFLIYYVILLARKKRILTSPYRVDDSQIHLFLLFFFHTSNTRNTTNSIIIIIIIISREDVVFCSCFSQCESAASGDAVSTLSGECDNLQRPIVSGINNS